MDGLRRRQRRARDHRAAARPDRHADVTILERLGYGGCHLAIAVRRTDPYEGPRSLANKRIATSYPALLARFLTEHGVASVIKELRGKFDWVICDSPAGIERGATLAMRFADAAVIVTNPEVSSVRDSDRIIGLLDSKTEKAEKGQRVEKHILITRYDAQRAARGEMLTIEDVLEILSTPLLGIIPESEEVLRASNIGSPITLSNTTSSPARAYIDAARRLKGDDVPMTIPSDRKGLFDKLFGRRAA